MEEKTSGCLKQTAIGCAVLLVIAIALPFVLGVMMMSPFKRAVDARLALEERFGPQEAYVPTSTGAPPADRIELFLGVRRALNDVCGDFTTAENQVKKLESFDDQAEVDRMEVVKQAFSTTRSMMGVGPLLGQLYEIRNQRLLEAGMGLGEYTYVYVVAYHDRLLDADEQAQLFGPATTNLRIRRALGTVLENQLDVLRSGGGTDAEVAVLEAEIANLSADERRLPWQDGLPTAITEALAPYRAELDRLYCPAMAPIELLINERRAFAVESR